MKLELSMPYEDGKGDCGNDITALLDQDCLLDLPPSLSVALLSMPFTPKIERRGDGSWFASLASLEGFNPKHLQSLALSTGILRHRTGEVGLSH